MSKKKTSINQNFEALKAQMQAKRKLAESKFEKEKENLEPDNITTINKVFSDDNIEDSEHEEHEEHEEPEEPEEIITLNIVEDKDYISDETNNAISTDITQIRDEKIAKGPEITITPTPKRAEHPDINMNKIIIKRVEKQEAPKRITYYLKPETIKKIDKFSKATGMGKSEFVQTILDEILNNLEVEK